MAMGRARIDRLTTSSLILLGFVVAACDPAPIQSSSLTPDEAINATAAPSKSPNACADGSLTVRDGRSLGRASILDDLDPVDSLGGQPNELEDRWSDAAPSSLQLGKFDTIFVTGSDERHLQAEVGTNDANEPQITMLVPIDESGQIRSVAIRW
jgi:hypothetical protein